RGLRRRARPPQPAGAGAVQACGDGEPGPPADGCAGRRGPALPGGADGAARPARRPHGVRGKARTRLERRVMRAAPPARAAAAPPRLLDADLDAPLDDVLARCREVVEDDEFPTVARWRESGGKVLGHFQVYFPEELAHAAGMLPVKIRGGRIDRREADSRFGSAICSLPRTALELALRGVLVPALFVTHPICDAARNLAGIWARNVATPGQILYFPQNPNSRFA